MTNEKVKILIFLLILFCLGSLLTLFLHNTTENKKNEEHSSSTAVTKASVETLQVRLHRVSYSDGTNFKYKLLDLILEHSGVPYELEYSHFTYSQEAAIENIRNNSKELNVGRFGFSAELNKQLRQIPIPVTGGLLGLRVNWINDNNRDNIKQIESLDDLRKHTIIQGHGWTDVTLYRSFGLNVHTLKNEQEAFQSIQSGRYELFPHGILEIHSRSDIVSANYPLVSADRHLLFVYPFAGFYYVNKANTRLYDAIEKGFKAIHENGVYKQFIRFELRKPFTFKRFSFKDRKLIYFPYQEFQYLLRDIPEKYWIVPWKALSESEDPSIDIICNTEVFKPFCIK